MKNQLLFAALALSISSCVTRDNPLDVKAGGKYISPTFSVAGIPADGVVLGAKSSVAVSGVSPAMIYQMNLDNSGWGGWTPAGDWAFSLETLADGIHTLAIQGAYPSKDSPFEYSRYFSVVTKENSLYCSPVTISLSSPSFTLACYDLEDSLVSLHIEMSDGSITSSAPSGDTAFVKTLASGPILDVTVFPGGSKITGTRAIATITLSDVEAGETLGFTAMGLKKSGESVTINSLIGTVVQ